MATTENLDTKRKDLVLAAEKVIRDAFVSGRRLLLKKTQLNHLIGICGEATCVEEIENFLRYQAGRGSDKTGWDVALVQSVIAAVTPVLAQLNDATKLAAWRLYAVYLTRSFTYESECRKSDGGRDRKPWMEQDR